MTRTLRLGSVVVGSICCLLIVLALATGPDRPYTVASQATADMIVIVDIGHGGRDPGATVTLKTQSRGSRRIELREHPIAYDIGVRTLRLLRDEPNIQAISTIALPEGETGQNRPIPRPPGRLALSTTPPCDLHEESIAKAVNLRWMLANSIYWRALRSKASPRAVVFISIHVDKHNSGPGAVVYVAPRSSEYFNFKDKHEYVGYEEGREVLMRRPLKVDRASERESDLLSGILCDCLERHGIDVADDRPVRDYSNSEGAHPAVLRNNQIPCRALLEVGNLGHPGDQERLMNPDYRQGIAEAINEAILLYRDRVVSEKAD